MSSLGNVNRTLRGDAMAASRSFEQLELGSIRMSTTNGGVGGKSRALAPAPCRIEVPSRRLRMWNGAMSLFHASFMVVILAVGNLDLGVPLYQTKLTFRARADVASGEAGSGMPAFVITPAYEEVARLPLTWLAALFFLCSAVAHFGNATLWRQFYETELSKCRVPTRWIEYFFSATIMILFLAYSVGVRDLYLLAAIGSLIATTMLFGWMCELVAAPLDEKTWKRPLLARLAPHLAGYIPQGAAWLIMLFTFYLGPDGASRAPSFVFVIVWVQLALFFSFGVVQLAQQLMAPEWYATGEIAYQWLSLIAKGFLGTLLLINVLVLGSFEEIFD